MTKRSERGRRRGGRDPLAGVAPVTGIPSGAEAAILDWLLAQQAEERARDLAAEARTRETAAAPVAPATSGRP
jgi:hypothetical protein